MLVLKLLLFHLPMLITLCFHDLFSYKFSMHRKWVRLKCVSYLLLDALLRLNSYSLVSIFCNLHAQLKGVKESACSEATQFVFPSVLSCLDDCYYCSDIIVSFFFKICAKLSLRKLVSSKVGACCRETDSVFLTEKFAINHQIIFLI